MLGIKEYREEITDYLKQTELPKEPVNLYQPIDYILNLGGKRLRPILVLLAADLLGADFKKALPAALAVEYFHNFSLVHDDIMDNAPIRRGHVTVHEKWDVNTGILSGDAMLIKAYQFFEGYEPQIFNALAKLFGITALKVCEGQQYDVDFETRDDVTLVEYIKMISFKTAVLVGASMQMGAIVAGASKNQQENMYDYGLNLGIAFQLQDDYLDVYGDPDDFGKQVGGDIIANKKTYLVIKALELGNAKDRKALLDLYSIQPKDPKEKILAVKTLFIQTGAAKATKEAIALYTKKALGVLENLKLSTEKRKYLNHFADQLMNRTF